MLWWREGHRPLVSAVGVRVLGKCDSDFREVEDIALIFAEAKM